MFACVELTQSQTNMRLGWAKSDFPRPSKKGKTKEWSGPACMGSVAVARC